MTRNWLGIATIIGVAAAAPALAQDVNLPDGPGKATVAAMCGTCHRMALLANGYTPEGWHTVMRMMLNFGVTVPKDEVTTVTDYLIKSFPERPRPAAAAISGPVEITIKQWPVPNPGSRPHDPLAARDGSIWYTGQLANTLGRVDPKTGAIKEYRTNDQTGPHGLVEGPDGNIWFTGNFRSLIGKLDPKTGTVTEYKMPDPAARDPHSLTFDRNGILWFTVQNGNFVGRLDPKTGDISLTKSPTANSRPTASWSIRRGFRSSSSSASTRSRASIRRPCGSPNTTCPIRPRGRAASRSRPTTPSGTRISRAASWAGSIPRPARSPNGSRRAGRRRRPTASP